MDGQRSEKFKDKLKVYRRWVQEQISYKEQTLFKYGNEKSRAYLELNMVRSVKGIKKDF